MFHHFGSMFLNMSQATGEMLKLFFATVYFFKEAPRNLPSIYRQLAEIGVNTLPIVSLAALFIGMVLALQTGSALVLYGSQSVIGSIVSLSMVKELGPVMTSLLVAGRVGSAMAAEIGAMEIYEEIDALKTLEINPVRYLAMPRLVACLLAVPALVIFVVFIGMVGGGVICAINPKIAVPINTYYDGIVTSMEAMDILKGLTKAFVFGGIIGLVSCYVGFKTTGGARGIGRSTTRSVVLSFLLIFIANYFLTRMMM